MEKLTPEQLHAFCTDLDALCEKYQPLLPGDGGLENLLNGIAQVLQHDAEQQHHTGVKGCLTGAAEMCEMAAMNYYASYK